MQIKKIFFLVTGFLPEDVSWRNSISNSAAAKTGRTMAQRWMQQAFEAEVRYHYLLFLNKRRDGFAQLARQHANVTNTVLRSFYNLV